MAIKKEYPLDVRIRKTSTAINKYMGYGSYQRSWKNIPDYVKKDMAKFFSYFDETGKLIEEKVNTRRKQAYFEKVMQRMSYLQGASTMVKGQGKTKPVKNTNQALRTIELFGKLTKNDIMSKIAISSDFIISLATDQNITELSIDDIGNIAQQLYEKRLSQTPNELKNIVDDDDYMKVLKGFIRLKNDDPSMTFDELEKQVKELLNNDTL